MSTKPIEGILSRQDKAGVQEELHHFADAIEEAVNFGTHVLSWMPDPSQHGDPQMAGILMLRHMLGMMDSISVAVRQSAIEPCGLLLRGVFESYLGLHYLLEQGTKKRAMEFRVWHIHETLKWFRKHDPTTEEGKQLLAVFKKNKGFNVSGPPQIPDVQKRIDRQESILKMPEFVNAEAAYQSTKQQLKSFPWYAIDGGPRKVEQLSQHLKLHDTYEVFYRSWSAMAHGTDIVHGKVTTDADGLGAIVALRNPAHAQLFTSNCLNFAHQTYRLVVEKLAPSKQNQMDAWEAEFGPFCKLILGPPLFTVNVK
jgi:hypothetical protein